jgi:hypothetical protein
MLYKSLFQAKGAAKKEQLEKKRFFQIAIRVFFILAPPTSSVHNFLIFVQLSDLNCSEITILSSTNHLVTLKATK